MKLIRGIPAAWNYSYGPTYFYKGPRSLDEIFHMGEPVVVVASIIPMDELRKMELTRVRGFVFEEGNPVDHEDHYNFFMYEKRAAVMSAKWARVNLKEGEWVIVDGVEGVVCVDPTPEVLERFQEIRKDGPPKRDVAAGAAMIMRHTMDVFFKKREEAKAKAEAEGREFHGLGHEHKECEMSVDAVKQAVDSSPGVIAALLQGVPLPKPAEPEPAPPDPRGRAARRREEAEEIPAEASAEERAQARAAAQAHAAEEHAHAATEDV